MNNFNNMSNEALDDGIPLAPNMGQQVIPPPHPFNPYDRSPFDPVFVVPRYETFYLTIANILETLSPECEHPLFITYQEDRATISVQTTPGNSFRSQESLNLEEFMYQFQEPLNVLINENDYDSYTEPEEEPPEPCVFNVSIFYDELPGRFMCRARQVAGERDYTMLSIMREFYQRLDDRLADMLSV